MDLNELFFQHQVALMRADRAGQRDARSRLYAEADVLASRINLVQRQLGACVSPLAGATYA